VYTLVARIVCARARARVRARALARARACMPRFAGREHVGTRGIARVCARARNDDKRAAAPVDPYDTIHEFIDFLLLSEVETSAEPPWLSASRHFFLPLSVPSSVPYGFGFESESSPTMMTKAPTIHASDGVGFLRV